MTKARTLADNYAADINQITADAPLTGGGTSGTVTVGIQAGTTAQSGAVQLTDSTASTSITTAATPNSVKSAYDLANGAIAKSVIAAKGDLLVGTANDTVDILSTGTTGQILTVDSSTTSGLKWATSQSGITWTQRVAGVGSNFNAIAYNGSNLYVYAGLGGRLSTSPDGITWTTRTSGFGVNDINSVAFGNSIWVAVGANGTITTSTDGVTWTARTANVGTSNLYAVTYANSTFVAVGANAGGGTGGITTSTDGITWTQRTTPAGPSPMYSVAYGNGEWIVVGEYGTRAGYYSTNLSTWTLLPSTLNQTTYQIFYDNSLWYAYRAGGLSTATTASGTWTSRSGMSFPNTNINSYHNAISVYGGSVYTVTYNAPYLIKQTTALDSQNRMILGQMNFLPQSFSGGSITSNFYGVFVNATGIIIWNDFGALFTSF